MLVQTGAVVRLPSGTQYDQRVTPKCNPFLFSKLHETGHQPFRQVPGVTLPRCHAENGLERIAESGYVGGDEDNGNIDGPSVADAGGTTGTARACVDSEFGHEE